MRKVLIGVVAAVVALIVVGALFGDGEDDGGNGANGGNGAGDAPEVTALGASPAEADCLPVRHRVPIPAGPAHQNGTLDWPEIPPDSGVHNAQTLRTVPRFYERDDDPAPERAVHDLEHGVVVAWYDRELPDEEVEVLEQVSDAIPVNRYVAVPWDRAPFADGRHFVLTAWGHTQRCRRVSGEVVYDFVRTYADKDAPEKGAPV